MTFYHHTRDSDDEDEDVTVDARHYSIYSLNTLQFAMRNSVDQKANYCALEGHLGPIVAASATGDHSHLRGNRRQTSVSAVLQATVLKLIILLQYCSLITFFHHTRILSAQ